MATLAAINAGGVVSLGPDLCLDGMSDPRVGLGACGADDAASDLGAAGTPDGARRHAVPESTAIDAHDEVHI